MLKILLFCLIGIIGLGFLIPTEIQASYTINLEDILGSTTLDEIFENIVDLLFKVSIVLVPLLIVLAAFMIATAAGDPNKVAQAKRLITWALIGFLIVLLSKGILAIIKQLFGLP